MRCMLAVTPSASPEPHRSNAGMIYVPCPSLHTTCSPAPELLATLHSSSNLSPYVRRRWGPKVREMKMTRPDLIVVSICGSRQDVCLNVHLSICPSVSLLSRRRVFACVGRDAVAAVSHYRRWADPGGGFTEEMCPREIVSLSQQSDGNDLKTFMVFLISEVHVINTTSLSVELSSSLSCVSMYTLKV